MAYEAGFTPFRVRPRRVLDDEGIYNRRGTLRFYGTRSSLRVTSDLESRLADIADGL
jgi:hypothetical protein